MSPGALVILALGLAMDATAVAAARGVSVPRVEPWQAVRVGLFFGGFHALLPLLGWLLGRQAGPVVQAWEHWIASALLIALGGKMIAESRGGAGDDAPGGGDPFGWGVMTALAFATSIDAFAVGVTLPMLGAPLAVSLATIGLLTGACSVAGLYAGRRFGAALGPRLQGVGGLVLIVIGARILVDHLI